MERVEVDVIAPILGSFSHCAHCQVFIDSAGIGGQVHRSDVESYPADMLAEFRALSNFLLRLGLDYDSRLVVRVYDPGSPRGMWQALRRRARRYPTFIVGDERIVGLDEARVEAAIRSRLPEPVEQRSG
jgi:hypothetical protein